MSRTVVLPDCVGKDGRDLYARLASERGLRFAGPGSEDEAALASLMATADALILRRRELTEAIAVNCPALRSVVLVGEKARMPEALRLRSDLKVKRIPRYTSLAVADLVLGLIIATSRNLVASHNALIDPVLSASVPTPRETTETEIAFNWLGSAGPAPLVGKTLGLVGFGEIGSQVATRARSFGVRVLYTQRRRLAVAQEEELGVCFAQLDDLLAESDFVSLHVPHTSQTVNLVSAEKLALMKRSAFLINTSRGRVVDEEALADALVSGCIAGAGLDVFAWEPLPRSSRLLGLKNVIHTPHIGGGDSQTLPREMSAAFDLLA